MARNLARASTQYLFNASIATGLGAATGVSLACWIKPTNITQIHQGVCLVEHAAGGNGDYIALYCDGANAGDLVDFEIFNSSSTTNVSTSAAYSANAWNAIMGVRASTTDRRVYLNGANKGSATASHANLNNQPTHIFAGAFNRSDTGVVNPLDGVIAEVALWGVGLTDAEAALYGLGVSPLLIRPQSLIFYAPLIGRYSPEIDLVGGFNMTLQNGPTTANHPRVLYPSTPFALSLAMGGGPGPGGGTVPIFVHHLRQQGIM